MGLTKEQKSMVAVLLFGAMLVVLNITFLSPALPTVMKDMNVDATTVQYLTSGYSMTEAVIIPLLAFFMGRFSTRRLFIGGFALFTLGAFLCAIAPVFPIMLLGRVCQAAATGVVMPMVFTLILLIFPREKRGSGMGLVTLIIGFAPAVGPSLSGILVDSVGWRMLFVIVTVISVMVMLVAWRVLKNFEGFHPTDFDVPSVIMSSVGMISLLYGFSTFSSSQNLVVTGVLVVAGAIILALFVRRQLHLEHPLLNVKVLASPRYRTTVIVVVSIQASLMGLSVIMPLFVQGILGYPATVSGLVMLPGAITGAIAGMVAGRLFDRVGVRPLVLVACCCLLLGACGMFSYNLNTPIILCACVYTINSLAMQFVMTPMNTWGVNSLDNSVIQHANALQNTLNQVAGSFGTALIVSVAALGSNLHPELSGLENTMAGYHLAYSTSAFLLVLVVLMIVVFVREKVGAKEAAEAAKRNVEMARAAAPEGMRNVSVADVMDKQVNVVRDTDTIEQALRVFAITETSGVPVVNRRDELVGFIADGDIMKYLGSADASFIDPGQTIARFIDDETLQQSVNDLMKMNVMRLATPSVITVSSDMLLKDACDILAERRIKKVPVVEDKKVVGTLSRRNIIHAITNTAHQ